MKYAIVILLLARLANATTAPGTVEVDPEVRGTLVTDWGYDIKNAAAINGLTESLAEALFIDDRMSVLRVAIWGDVMKPAHPAPGEIDVSYYVYDGTEGSEKMFTAMKNARDARSDVIFFASKKSFAPSMPAWTLDGNGDLDSEQYARMLADYLRFWEHDLTRKSESFTFPILGINNEGAAFPVEDYAKHMEVITNLWMLSQQAGTVDLYDRSDAVHPHVTVPAAFTMPESIIGPERWGPQPDEVANLLAIPGADATLDLIGTHYYAHDRPYDDLAALVAAGNGRPAWNSEVHWVKDLVPSLDDLEAAEITLATIFDGIDLGLSGYSWWAYSRTGFKGEIKRAITTSTTLARSCAIDDEDGYASPEVTGSLITRAFREGNSLRIWALNVGDTPRPGQEFNLLRGRINGDVSFTRWFRDGDSFSSSNSVVAAVDSTSFSETLPTNSITLFTLSYRMPAYTWDVAPGTVGSGDNAITTGNGTWDTSTGNWTLDEGTNNVAWVNGSNAYFSAGQTISLASGVSVGGIALENGPVTLKAIVDNDTLTVIDSPTWNLKTRTLKFLNNQVNDTRLAMASGQTLTVTGTTATLDTGEKPIGADWNVAGATFDFQASSGTLKGNKASVGKFSMVKMAGGSTFIHERNANETYVNNWELGTGTVTIDNRYSRNITLNGVVSGDGALQVQNLGNRSLLPRGTNTFSGGLIVDSTNSLSMVNINADTQLGAVPGAVDADNITLRNGGVLLLNSMTINANRGIALDGGGTVVLSSFPSTYGGKITGAGGLQIGQDLDSFGNTLVLSGNTSDYIGGTRIYQGSITLGTDHALPTDTVLTIGGKGTSALKTDGFDLSIGGLTVAGSNTRYIENNGAGASTITINTEVGTSYVYRGNLQGSGGMHIVKNGKGTQEFNKTAYTTTPASITINEGSLNWDAFDPNLGLVTVNSNAVLGGRGQINTVDFQLGSRLHPGSSSQWIDTLEFTGDVDISGIAAADVEGIQIGFNSSQNDLIVATNGTLTVGSGELGFSDFAFNDNDGLASGVYTVMVASAISGTLDPADLSGTVGNKGATGTLSVSGGAVVVTVTAGDYSAYAEWVKDFGLTGDSAAEDADPDSDTYSNLQEFAFGGDPTNSSVTGYVPDFGIASQGGTNWLVYGFAYRTNANSGVDYNFRTAPDLVCGPWTNANYTVLGTSMIDSEFAITTNAISMTDTRYFMGLFLEKQ